MSSTAPKESHSPGASIAHGSKKTMTASASARVRHGEAICPLHSAAATMVTIQKVRCAGTPKPASSV
jgi:hypothetical protein